MLKSESRHSLTRVHYVSLIDGVYSTYSIPYRNENCTEPITIQHIQNALRVTGSDDRRP